MKTDLISFLQALIRVPSFSGEESGTAELIDTFLNEKNVRTTRIKNNVVAQNLHFSGAKPLILLNSHHDTVRPNKEYTRNPYSPDIEGDSLFGLGSNDAGGALVAIIGCFLHFYDKADLPFDLMLLASAEEENSGKNGVELALQYLPPVDLAIVGEPTSCQMAIAEKGLLVLDCESRGQAGHAARNEGTNAIYEALEDIEILKKMTFAKESSTLGAIKISVTQIEAGTQHNVVPDYCKFVIDVRTTDAYSLEETLEIIQSKIKATATPRSIRLRPSSISEQHPIVQHGIKLGLKSYGSPTLSDQALMPFESIKIGPGESARSHTSNEFIKISEIEQGLQTYIALLECSEHKKWTNLFSKK